MGGSFLPAMPPAAWKMASAHPPSPIPCGSCQLNNEEEEGDTHPPTEEEEEEDADSG